MHGTSHSQRPSGASRLGGANNRSCLACNDFKNSFRKNGLPPVFALCQLGQRRDLVHPAVQHVGQKLRDILLTNGVSASR